MTKCTSSLHRRFIFEFLKAMDCPRALTVWLLFREDEHQQLVDLEFNPEDYNCCCEARDSLAATKLLSKADFLSLSVDRKEVALKKFFDAEQQCKEANHRIRSSQYKNTETAPILLMAAAEIDLILMGSFPIDDFLDACNWGPGSTLALRRREATSPKKFAIESQITSKAHDLFGSIMDAAYPHWDRTTTYVEHNKVITVPKNAKTDRVIAVEPGINLWLQKGVGTILRRRLKGVGIDLNSQEYNQQRAKIGSLCSSLATVDFSAASDTVSRAIVEELIPQQWLLVLEALRSNYGKVGESYHYYHKFSSMGNGFTFELESLIFYALAVATTRYLGLSTRHISVFGDDVILPTKAYDVYARVCADVGFKVNLAKSYSASYYRESCGSHYWGGVDIKPIFLKEPLYERTSILKAANRVREYAHRRNVYGSDRLLRRSWLILAGACGSKTPRIPAGYGDLGLVDTIDNARDLRRPDGQLEGLLVPMLVTSPVMSYYDCRGLLNFKLKSIGTPTAIDLINLKLIDGIDYGEMLDAGGNEIPRPTMTRTSRKRVLVPRWTDYGEWE